MKTQALPGTRPVGLAVLRVPAVALALLVSACSRDSEPEAPTSPAAETYTAEIATKWTDTELSLIRKGTGFTPPIAARALAYAGVALYEAVAPGMAAHQSLAGQLTDLGALPRPEPGQRYNWAVAANASQAVMLRNLFGNATTAQRVTIDSLEAALNQPYRAAPEFARSVQFGQQVGQAAFAWSRTDGGHEAYLNNQPASYVPPVGPGLWMQTAPGNAGRALLPYWGQNRLFVPANATMLMPALSYVYSTQPGSAYYAEAQEVYNTSRTLTPAQRTIALYWADAGQTITPPGHSMNIASIALRSRNASLATAAETYCRMGIALSDAFVNCWKCKYVYNWERPVTCIRAMMDPAWQPLIATPPFPEFASGHSTQSGAAAEVLAGAFGAAVPFVDDTHRSRGAGFEPRPFASFAAFANEAAMSRLYGGIHFRSANEVGLTEGQKIGRNVNALRFRR